jgi:Tol biopolymer transport system component
VTRRFILPLAALLVFAGSVLAGADRAPYASDRPISAPRVFAPREISTGDYESHPHFSHDGRTLYFVKLTPDFNFWTIVTSRFENGRWTEPEVAPFSGRWSDADPFVTADGSKLFFISKRPLADGGEPRKTDIWVMDRTAAGWGEPKHLGAPIDTDEAEWYPTVAANGTLYFGSNRPGGKGLNDLYRSRLVDGKYQRPENLGDAINTEFDEYEPFIAPDESYLIFMALGRPDGLGGYDLYISHNRNGAWTKAENLGAPINSPVDDLGPKMSPDGKYFFWSSTRGFGSEPPLAHRRSYAELMDALHGPGNGLGDIYQVDASVVVK